MKSKNERTLLDYNGPPITELSDIRNGQVFANHVRVKRSKFMNYSLPHFLSKNDTIYASDESLSRFDGSYVNSNNRIESDTLSTTTRTYSRYKRRVLSKNRQRRKRVKGNIRHPKHSIEAEIGGKKLVVPLDCPISFPRRKVVRIMCCISHEYSTYEYNFRF